MAAFQETITSGRTPFDDFRDALARGDRSAAAAFPEDAQRGAQIFVGRGKCNVCHTGAGFTNGEFADAGVPYFIEPGRVDPGRHGGIAQLRRNTHNLTGRYNDDPDRKGAWATRQVADLHSNFGAFKVPTFRSLTRTAPYFHDGSKATLADVVRHYSEIDLERLHTDGEKILAALETQRNRNQESRRVSARPVGVLICRLSAVCQRANQTFEVCHHIVSRSTALASSGARGAPAVSHAKFSCRPRPGSMSVCPCDVFAFDPQMVPLLRSGWGQNRRALTMPWKKWSDSGRRSSRLGGARCKLVCL